ncbi:MAG: hypothetical protein ACJ746_03980 [Bryobacteraceae bacterium]
MYRIDPNTAVATLIAPTRQFMTAVTQVNGIFYAFNVGTQQLLNLKLANGGTSLVAGVGPGSCMSKEQHQSLSRFQWQWLE